MYIHAVKFGKCEKVYKIKIQSPGRAMVANIYQVLAKSQIHTVSQASQKPGDVDAAVISVW